MEIHLIWAQDFKGGIGKNGELPWHITEDLKNFKNITLNSTIIMGRKTWDSLPFKPLPNRRNIILSNSNISNIEVYHSIDDCIKTLQQECLSKIFIIGGSSIYKEFFNYATHLHITFVNIKLNNLDTFFPIDLHYLLHFIIRHHLSFTLKYHAIIPQDLLISFLAIFYFL